MYAFEHFGGSQHPYTLSSSVVLIHDADSQQNIKNDVQPGSDKDDAEVPQHMYTSKSGSTMETPSLNKDAGGETGSEEITDGVVAGTLHACMHVYIALLLNHVRE